MGIMPKLGSVTNYREMLFKLCVFQMVVFSFCLVMVREHVSWLDSFLEQLDLVLVEWSINSYASALILGILYAYLTHAVKLHDKLSDLFYIRKNFDFLFIIYPVFTSLGLAVSVPKQKALYSDRHETMHNIFYKYASSTSDTNLVSDHEIHQALTHWSWTWVLVETSFTLFWMGIVSLLTGGSISLLWLIAAAFLFSSLVPFSIRESRKYALAQVSQIVSDENASDAIREYVSAI